MKNKIKGIGLISLFFALTIFASGCTSSNAESLVWEHNFSKSSTSGDYYSISVNGSKIRIEYSNLTIAPESDTFVTITNGFINVYALNTIPQEGQTLTNYSKNLVSTKQVHTNNTIINGSIEFDDKNIKGLLLLNQNCKGNIKIYVS